jgi:dihydrodipicolinate synthase/N-acetylneuraminate lyase
MADFHGVMPPIPTPFNQDYSINIEALRGLVEHLITGGVHAMPISFPAALGDT